MGQRKGYKQTEEHKRKIGESNKGKVRSEESKQKNREKHLGENNFWFGKIRSKETRQKMSKSAKGNKSNTGKKFSEEHKRKKSIAQSGEKGSNWQGGKSFGKYCPKFNNMKKEEIRNQYNRKCYFCGKEEKDNITKTNRQFKLHIHHIDEDKEQGCNGKQWKLVPLCIHCHPKVHHNKIKVKNANR